MILDKWDYRVSDLVKGGKSFIEESYYKITFNESNCIEYFWNLFNDPDTAIIVNYRDDVFRGFAIVTRETEGHTEYFGYLVKFYVMPSARGTGVSREMAQEMVDWFDKRECAYSFATATAGISQDKQFINLLAKFNYKNLGGNLVRKQYGQSEEDR